MLQLKGLCGDPRQALEQVALKHSMRAVAHLRIGIAGIHTQVCLCYRNEGQQQLFKW